MDEDGQVQKGPKFILPLKRKPFSNPLPELR
jgi:hypothetical protein